MQHPATIAVFGQGGPPDEAARKKARHRDYTERQRYDKTQAVLRGALTEDELDRNFSNPGRVYSGVERDR